MVIEKNVPLAEKVLRTLRRRIKSEYVSQGRLPSEEALASEFAVSRSTVRDALARLEREGLIIRKQGVGTFVNSHALQIKAPLNTEAEFCDLIRKSGFTAKIEYVDSKLELATPDVAQKLKLSTDEEVLAIRKLFLADGQPAIFCTDIVPIRHIVESYSEYELHQPIFDFLARTCYQEIEYDITEIVPIVADAALASFLDCQVGSPLLFFDEIGYNEDNQPILNSLEYYKSQLIRFKVLRKKV